MLLPDERPTKRESGGRDGRNYSTGQRQANANEEGTNGDHQPDSPADRYRAETSIAYPVLNLPARS